MSRPSNGSSKIKKSHLDSNAATINTLFFVPLDISLILCFKKGSSLNLFIKSLNVYNTY